jgi:hypothetical protein
LFPGRRVQAAEGVPQLPVQVAAGLRRPSPRQRHLHLLSAGADFVKLHFRKNVLGDIFTLVA